MATPGSLRTALSPPGGAHADQRTQKVTEGFSAESNLWFDPFPRRLISNILGSILVRLPSNRNMKRKTIVCMGVGALGCQGFLAAGQGIMHTGSPQALSTHWPGTTQTNILAVPIAGSNWLFRTLPPANKPEFKSQTLPPPVGPISPSAPATVPPGVYRTVPYSCIVVVPGPHPDDRCIVRPPDVDFSMPIIKPELQFIPCSPAKEGPAPGSGITNR
jgi:hypothetical protein